jgi:hypothetical protein
MYDNTNKTVGFILVEAIKLIDLINSMKAKIKSYLLRIKTKKIKP